MRDAKTPVRGFDPVFGCAVGVGVGRDHLTFEHHGFNVEVVIVGNSEEPDVFRALFPV